LSSRLLSKNIKIRVYKTVILVVVLYGRKTWSLILKEEHRLKVFENRVLRRIFGPKSDEVTKQCRKLHNDEVHNLYSSPNIFSMMKEDEMGRACSTNGEEEECI
jgi:dihydrofolate reductase